MADHLQTVQQLYEAFGRGDVATVLERMSPGVVMEAWADNHAQAAGVPLLQRREGREGAAEFFGVVGAGEMHAFEVLSLMAGGDQVCAEVRVSFTPAGGRRIDDEELHLWTFGDDGLVHRMRHYVDTAKHIAAVA